MFIFAKSRRLSTVIGLVAIVLLSLILWQQFDLTVSTKTIDPTNTPYYMNYSKSKSLNLTLNITVNDSSAQYYLKTNLSSPLEEKVKVMYTIAFEDEDTEKDLIELNKEDQEIIEGTEKDLIEINTLSGENTNNTSMSHETDISIGKVQEENDQDKGEEASEVDKGEGVRIRRDGNKAKGVKISPKANVTVVLLGYYTERVANLKRAVELYRVAPIVAKVVLIWNGGRNVTFEWPPVSK
eukprot:Ihof_evm14s54 gene=Ihof_evmTU14s54